MSDTGANQRPRPTRSTRSDLVNASPTQTPSERAWGPLGRPNRVASTPGYLSPFARLARAHAAAVAGDTSIAISLAGSLFFSTDPKQARWKVAAYLLLTIAPFAVVGPFIGPAIDRMAGGRRLMVIVGSFARAAVCLIMIRDLNSPLLFPEAFVLLALGKSYHVAKSALVPTVVKGDAELVEANSKLQLVSGVMGFVASIPAVLLSVALGPGWVVLLAAIEFSIAGMLGLRLPLTTVATKKMDSEERHELRSGGVLLAVSAMAMVRGLVGFMTFLLAFTLRTEKAPAYWFGIMLAASTIGGLTGAAIAPPLRKAVDEERVLVGSIAVICFAAVVATIASGRVAAAALALAIGVAASTGKMAFDSIVQRDAPEANRARAFARFETRFQLAWVIGAFLPVALTIPLTIGFIVIAGGSGFAAVSYFGGQRTLLRTGRLPDHKTNPRMRLPRRASGGTGSDRN